MILFVIVVLVAEWRLSIKFVRRAETNGLELGGQSKKIGEDS